MLELRDRHGLDVAVDTAADDIVAWRNQIAERLRIQQRSANRYITDDALSDLAAHIARCFENAKHPPAPVIELARKRAQRDASTDR